ncbi:MAG: polyprenyl synthetase family protein [Acidiferrobacterales bacterium]|nr:polyprenyl synthetase family protein [Acidiferrobacterales bacterium]
MPFKQDWTRCRKLTEQALDARLPPVDLPPQSLHEAMRYATLNGGKRFRATLAIMTGEMLGVETELLLPSAVAVECVHAFSLVHDDLPCMDDDDFRRGKLSCHAVYGEAMGVLVGDALHSLAMEILAKDESLVHFQHKTGQLVAALAEAAGSTGMIGGQVLDIELTDSDGSIDLHTVFQLKTAKLIQGAVKLGALMCDDLDARDYEALCEYGEAVGLAFQYVDDHLDGEHLGENLLDKAVGFRDQAISALQRLNGTDSSNLVQAANFVVERKY